MYILRYELETAEVLMVMPPKPWNVSRAAIDLLQLLDVENTTINLATLNGFAQLNDSKPKSRRAAGWTSRGSTFTIKKRIAP